ncbi:protein boule-like [Aulostomus maculatus]
MKKAAEEANQKTGCGVSMCNSPVELSSSSSPALQAPHLGTIIPNRIFVGGMDYRVNESDLRHAFSQHGAVKEVKIVIDRSGVSKGFGFVTFETEEDALKVLHDVTKTSSVPSSNRVTPSPLSCGTVHLTTSSGYSYTYHDGMAYFQCPNMSPPSHQWPPTPPVMLPRTQPTFYQQPVYHHYQCVPNQYQWNPVQSLMPSSPVVYPQPSEYLYQTTDGGSSQDAVPEFAEAAVQQVYPLHPQRTDAAAPVFPQQDPGQPKHHRYARPTDCRYLPEASETLEPSVICVSHPVV